MRNFIDLHTHSNISDGAVTPPELIRLADAKRLAAVALTDHDTTAGLAAARQEAARHPRLRFIGGIEISARYAPGTMHILGLGIDETCPQLVEMLQRLRQARSDRNPRMVAKLKGMGLDIHMDDLYAIASTPADTGERTIGRLHMAEAIVRKGYAKTIREAFERFVGDQAPAYVDKEHLEPSEAVRVIALAGGAAVLAHPVQLKCSNTAQLERIVRSLIPAGLAGIEVYHSDHTLAQTRMYLDLARKHRLLVTGGSDFHGAAKPDVRLGLPRVPVSSITPPWARKWLGVD